MSWALVEGSAWRPGPPALPTDGPSVDARAPDEEEGRARVGGEAEFAPDTGPVLS
jgi:hypothetical protein